MMCEGGGLCRAVSDSPTHHVDDGANVPPHGHRLGLLYGSELERLWIPLSSKQDAGWKKGMFVEMRRIQR